MQATKEMMIQEALERMKLLKLHKNAIDEFREEGKLNLSEQTGALYWLSDEQLELVRRWESETGNLAYHVIHCYTEFGELLNLLYVAKYAEEWDLDRSDLDAGSAFCYVMNLDDGFCSEFGSIGIQPMIGGVRRIW